MAGNIEKTRKYASTVISRMRPGGFQDWLSVLLVFLTLLVAAWSLEQAHWVSSSLSLVLTLVLAILATSLIVVFRLRDRVTIISTIVIGLLVMVWKSSAIVPRAEGESALIAWWHSVSRTLPSQNSVYFAMFLIIITWIIGCLSTWFVLKKRNAWVTVLLGVVMLLFNISNLPNNYYYFLLLYILFALLLIFQVNFAKQNEIVKSRRDKNPFQNITYLILAVFFVIVLVVSAAWVSPQPPLAQIGVKFNTSSMHDVDPHKEPLNIFSPISDKWSWVESSDQTKLLFTAGSDESETILYLVTSDKPVYLLTRRYDTYNSWGWTSNPTIDESISAGSSIVGNTPSTPSNTLSYSVENRAKSDVILTTGQFVSADIPVILKMTPLNQTDEAQGGNVLAVTSPWVLGPYQHYNVVNSVPTYTTEQLNAVNSDFPDWVTRQYLQLPDNFPESVKNLSLDLVKNAATQYDKLLAIKQYLNTLRYDSKGTVPSGAEDAVALFLYSAKKGNCVNFASAMVTMLRSVGIPARFCTGYLHGDYDNKTGKYIVRSKHAHAWAEVYFPGYGWIQFEATPDTGASSTVTPVVDNATFNYTDKLPSWMQPDSTPEDSGPLPSVPYTPVHRNSGIWIFFAVCGGLVLIAIAIRRVFDIRVQHLIRIKNPSEAFGRMCYLASFNQAGPMAQETPLEYAKRLATVIRNYDDYIENITQSYVTVRYSPLKEIMEEDKQINLQKSWKVVCQTLIRRRLQSGKWFLVRMLLNPE